MRETNKLSAHKGNSGLPIPSLFPSCVPVDNFGDRLAPFLINEVLGPHFSIEKAVGVEDVVDGIKIFSIGSFLSRDMFERPSNRSPFVVLGTGAGYSEFPIIRTFGLCRKFPARVGNVLILPLPRQKPTVNPWHRIYWVRGPLTAQLLGLPDDMVVGDAGYIIRKSFIFGSRHAKGAGTGVAFMPHITAAFNCDYLMSLCSDMGIEYIDPRDPQETILAKIGHSRKLLTEALHGAVIADALRVPWVPLKSSEDIFEFKWRDFCASIGIEYDPVPIRIRWNVHNFTGRNPRSMSKYLLNRMRSGLEYFLTTPRDTAYDLLLAMGRRPKLSKDSEIDRIDTEIDRRLELLIRDIRSGVVFA